MEKERKLHKLMYQWIIYLRPPMNSDNATEEEWVQSFHKIYTFNTVEAFWKFVKDFSLLTDIIMFFLLHIFLKKDNA